MRKVGCITTIQALPGHRDALLQVCRKYARLMLATEPGTLRMEFLTPFDDENRIVLWDVYENLEAVDAHRNGKRLQEFIQATKDLVVSISGVRHLMTEDL